MDKSRKATVLLLIAATVTQGGCGVFAKRKPSSFVLTPPDAALDIAAGTKPPTRARMVMDGVETTAIGIGLVAGVIVFVAFELWANSEESAFDH